MLIADIDMNFGTGPARTGVAHFPEIILFTSVNNSFSRYNFVPVSKRFVIPVKQLSRVAAENRYIKPVFINAINFGKQFPCPFDGFFLEIIAKRPIAKHFEHGVMVSVVAHFLKVVVLTRNPQTLLCVRNSGSLWMNVAKKIFLELVHAGIGKH